MGALGRRLFTIPRTFLAFAIVTLTLPALALVAACIDVVRAVLFRGGPWVVLRLVLFLECFLLAEVIGLASLFFTWVASGFGASRDRLTESTYAVQSAWIAFLFASLRRIFDVRFDVEGDEVVAPGPILVFIRHASVADTMLPSIFITRRHGVRLRFVLKRELLQEPCLDVAGHRIPNHFVARGSKDGDAEVEAVRELTRDLGAQDGVLIYPEGTRFTEGKRRALLDRLAGSDGPAFARAKRFRSVLPPKHGGPLALLDGYTPVDVVIVAHRGLEGLSTVADAWRGELIGRTVSMRMWRIPKASIPASRAERAAWLDEQWAAVDAWVSGDTTA